MSEQTGHAGVPTWELHHRLARSLEFAGVKPAEMATELEVAETTIRNYLAQRTKPNGATLRVWAMRCGVPYRWLKDGDDYDSNPDGGGGQPVSPSA